MDILFLCVVVFLLLLAVFDLTVGVSNDAVNFLNSAVGSKAGSLKRIMTVAAIGVFLGAAMSNGMMDIARHGIFNPEHFSFYDLMCIFMAVMVIDIILLDVFNTLGLPTSTTVSMVFELLGATFIVSTIKMASESTSVGLIDLINTEKALTVIFGIFLSVAIAFVFGVIVQIISRMVFSFNYRKNLFWKIGIYGGLCTTAIVYFILIKGAKDFAFMTPDVKLWISENTALLMGGCFVVMTVLMQILHFLKVNVLKVVVLMGTFSLAVAFAGNDLVNFIGVPLTGLDSFRDFMANSNGDEHSFMMTSLQSSANTNPLFLVGAGVIMVIALLTSKKTKNVSKTEIGLGSQQGSDEMFGSSRIARRLVRWTLQGLDGLRSIVPLRVRRWYDSRFNIEETIMEHGAAFDLVRGSVNLVLAGALIALGTSLKLPLSTTFVTFMVAMGTSLADRAWSRESAVFRITGVISVIGGWFLTAGAAFIGSGLIVALMYWGGQWMMIALAVLTVVIIVRSNMRFREKVVDDRGDALFQSILSSEDKSQIWPLVRTYIVGHQTAFLKDAAESFNAITQAFVQVDVRTLDKHEKELIKQKALLRSNRRKQTLCLRQVNRATAIEKSAWFHLGNNSCMSILYNLRHIDEICKEHVENNFLPLPEAHREKFNEICSNVTQLFNNVVAMTESEDIADATPLRKQCEVVKNGISQVYHGIHEQLHDGDPADMTVIYVYLNTLQEAREMVSTLRKYIRASAKLFDSEYSGEVARV